MRTLVIATIFVAAAGARAFAESHIDKATAAHAAGNFDVALDELEAAYAEDPKPEYLYAIGQVQGKLGHCTKAIEAYEKFLETVKDKDTKVVVQQAIDACKVPKDTVVPTKPIDTNVQPPPPPPEKPQPTKNRPFYTDVLGDVLVGAGVAAGVAGVVFYVRARAELDDAEGSATIDAYLDHVTAARDARTIAIIAGVAGGSFLVSGILRYALHDETYSVAVTPAADGGGSVSLGGRF